MIKTRRIFAIGIIILVGFGILAARLAQIQLFDTQSFSGQNLIRNSINQRTSAFIINNGRGLLVDRNGIKINATEKEGLVLFPFLKQRDWPIEKVAGIVGVSSEELKKAVKTAKKPFLFDQDNLVLDEEQKKAINLLNIPGVHVLKVREDPIKTASYIVGATGENDEVLKSKYPDLIKNGLVSKTTPVGIMGLEQAYDPFLLSRNEDKLLYHTTGDGQPLFGDSVRYASQDNSSYYPLKVVTTLDTDIQQMAEEAVNAAHLKRGGVVILDATTSDLLAMVSRPKFDPESPFAHKNLMLVPQYPGSVFKVVTAAAAIQNNIVDNEQTFDCNQNPYGTGAGNRKLGSLSFDESFYQSCNFTFASLAQRLMETDSHVIDHYATDLGLTRPSGWIDDVFHFSHFEQIPNEGTNVIWKDNADRGDPEAIAQTAIGQLNVRMTPLSIANMMATISRGGEKRSVRTATEIDYHGLSGVKLTTFPHQVLDGPKLDPYTAMRLEALLRGVVKNKEGTGYSLHDCLYTVAGKSGTAETDHGHTNQWFSGYFPADDPKYVMVVVDLDRHGGDEKTYDIYHSLVDNLYHYDQKKG